MFNEQILINKARENGGISVNSQNEKPKSGYMVSLLGYEKVIKLRKLTASQIRLYLKYNARYMNSKNMFFGIWIDNKSVYLDISINIQDRDRAIKAGIINRQKAIYDVTNQSVIKL